MPLPLRTWLTVSLRLSSRGCLWPSSLPSRTPLRCFWQVHARCTCDTFCKPNSCLAGLQCTPACHKHELHSLRAWTFRIQGLPAQLAVSSCMPMYVPGS